MISTPPSPPTKSGDSHSLAKREDGRGEATSFFAQIASNAEGGLPAGAGPKRQINGMIILAIVVLAAGAGLVTMRRIGLGSKLELLDLKIDYPIEAAAALSMDHSRVLTELSANAHVTNQVPIDQVQKNPFRWDPEMVADIKVDTVAKPAKNTSPSPEQIAAENRRKIEAKFNTLALNSVMDGRVPVATIAGKLVKVGDTIDGTFIVGAIRPKDRTVELLADGRTYTLTMKDPT